MAFGSLATTQVTGSRAVPINIATCRAAGITLVGRVSPKAAVDIDWTEPAAQTAALAHLLAEVDRLEQWVAAHGSVSDAPPVQAALEALRRVLAQDLEPDPTTGQRRIRRGVAADRRPSLGDPEMRHGRKTRTRVFTGYKRHVVKAIDADVIVGAIARPANEPEHQALETLLPDVRRHGVLAELQIDRGYLGSPVVATLDGDGGAHGPLPAATCQVCARRSACTTSSTGRSITIHPQEPLLQRLRTVQREPAGRAQLRHRTTVEHSLARVDRIQGARARYKGTRKNTLDVRRAAVVTILQRIARLPTAA